MLLLIKFQQVNVGFLKSYKTNIFNEGENIQDSALEWQEKVRKENCSFVFKSSY